MSQPEPTKTISAPPVFCDKQERVWTIDLTYDVLDDVLRETQVDLIPDNHDVNHLTQLLFNRKQLVAVLWECVREQAEKRKVEQRDFYKGLDGEAISKGWGAVVDAVLFFIQSQSPALAESLRQVIEAEMRVIEAGAEELVRTIQSTETDAKIREAVGRVGKTLQRDLSAALDNSDTR